MLKVSHDFPLFLIVADNPIELSKSVQLLLVFGVNIRGFFLETALGRMKIQCDCRNEVSVIQVLTIESLKVS